MRLTGMMASAVHLLRLGRFQMRPFQRWTLGLRIPPLQGCRKVTVSQVCVDALVPWRDRALLMSGVSMGEVISHKVITTDASLSGWGATHEGRSARGLWAPAMKKFHINYLELMAIYLALKQFEPLLLGCHVLIKTDNTAALYYLNKQGGLSSRTLDQLAREITLWCLPRLRSIRASHVPGLLSERRGRSVVQGCSSVRGLVSTPSGGEADLLQVWGTTSRYLCFSREREVSPLLLSEGPISSGDGRIRIRVAQGPSLCVSTSETDSPHIGEGQVCQPGSSSGGTSQGRVEVSDHSTALSVPLAASLAQGPAASGGGRDLPSRPTGPRPVGLARERENLLAAGFSTAVIATIQSAKASSTKAVYDGRWNAFLDWCEVQEPPVVAHLAPAQRVLVFCRTA